MVWLYVWFWFWWLLHLRLLLGLAVTAVAVASAAAARGRLSPDVPRAAMDTFESLGLPALALFALGLGTGALRRDADHGALDAFLLRPRAAVALPLGRWLASTLVVTGFGYAAVALAAAATAAFARPLAIERIVLLVAGLPLGAAAYCAIFLAMATIGRSAAAVAVVWWLAVDFGLSRVADGLARVSVHPALLTVVGFDTDLSVGGDAGLAVRAAVVQLLLLTIAGLAVALVRLRGDAPGA